MANIGFLRIELGRPATGTASVQFENEDRTSQSERTIDLVGASVAARERYPFAEDAVARVPENIAYFRLRRMESDEDYIAGFAAWIQENRKRPGCHR